MLADAVATPAGDQFSEPRCGRNVIAALRAFGSARDQHCPLNHRRCDHLLDQEGPFASECPVPIVTPTTLDRALPYRRFVPAANSRICTFKPQFKQRVAIVRKRTQPTT